MTIHWSWGWPCRNDFECLEPVSLGMRWPVERANSWMSNFGQLRRNTYCFIHHRVDQIALAVAIVITVNLVKWADPWSPAT